MSGFTCSTAQRGGGPGVAEDVAHRCTQSGDGPAGAMQTGMATPCSPDRKLTRSIAGLVALMLALAVVPSGPRAEGVASEQPAVTAGSPSWTRVSPWRDPASAVAVRGTQPSLLLAGTPRGARVSTDGGSQWETGPGAPIGCLSIDPADPDIAYAGTWFSGAYRTEDGGVSWVPVSQGLAARDVHALLVDNANPGIVYAGTEAGVFRSGDAGVSWTSASWGLDAGAVHALTQGKSSLYAATGRGVFRSSNNADSWAPASVGLGARNVRALVLGGGTLFAGTESGLYRSLNAGASWQPVGPALSTLRVNALRLPGDDPMLLFAGTDAGFFASNDGGSTWLGFNAGLTGWARQIHDLAVTGTTPPWTIYAATGDGVWRLTLPSWQTSVDQLPLILKEDADLQAAAARSPVPTATNRATPTRTLQPTATSTVPAIAGIHGTVTDSGTQATNVELKLRHWDGTTWSTGSTTRTDGEGRYLFSGVGSLSASEVYYVRYDNPGDPERLNAWLGPDITSYSAGANVPGGDFDIANVGMVSPISRVSVALPSTFVWERRRVPGDTYRFRLFDLDGTDAWRSSDLGDTDRFTLSQLPDGGAYGKEYGWHVMVYRGPESYGTSYYFRRVTFTSGPASTRGSSQRAMEVAIPREGRAR